jgi:ABC-type transport system substrate-binding protein
VLRDRGVRRALAQAVDRATAARAVFGPGAVAPPGPMSRALWIWSDSIAVPSLDTSAARAALRGRRVTLDILVPGTSVARRNLAQIIQEQWRRIGVAATITSVDFPVFQERLRTGRFQSFVGAWLDEPSPRGLADQWTSSGIGVLNYTHYRSHGFDALVFRALAAPGDAAVVGRIWREAMDTLNADVPAVFLYNPTNVAAVARRIDGVQIDPFSWLQGLPDWSIRNR